jgi:hypothetical protein
MKTKEEHLFGNTRKACRCEWKKRTMNGVFTKWTNVSLWK